MCLIFISVQDHPTYKLIIAANRDEFYQRKTAPASYWRDHPEILGGRDLEAQGTWMAMNKNGRIAMVTNYRDIRNIKHVAPSRGALVTNFLLDGSSPENYLGQVESKGQEYNGFNLVVGSGEELWYNSNYKQGVHKLSAGLHGLSNHLLDTPWPKVERGLDKMKSLLTKPQLSIDSLFSVLFDDMIAADDKLPDTGVGLERERMLSSMFIKSPGYGTRCSTVVLIDRDDHVNFSERVFDLQTFDFTQRDFQFDIRQ
ncbi:MAG TPA: NRDE family protein [Cyclobacteriaceae bacterium]|nr:NRDE family protein [Cyclobacteriaceae bacterium]HMV09120.1 NRDE family protein [Cyclobacteriaceae bacterium]HMV89633.1 NRDE family protein [Cyclobacteriaceae bacterium]HMW99475.1 NRDE family protein [Cyclobacteriaceae bacterium]HMX48736.1 NRDE family protein [Cyclobacteriaceae bacterium]